MTLGEVLAGLQQAVHLARLHHQYWAADACEAAIKTLGIDAAAACATARELLDQASPHTRSE